MVEESGSEILEGSLEEYDSQIAKAKADLKYLEYRRNLRVPICRLPIEILARIFVWTFDSESIPRYETTSRSYLYDEALRRYFPVVLSVCRLWRTVAVNAPAMWTRPNFSYPKFAEVMLGYAKSAPLEISWSAPHYQTEKYIPVLTQALKRASSISSINLSSNAECIERLLSVMVEPSPLLQSLEIHCQNYGTLSLPPKFLGEEAPRLTRLSIYGVVENIPWASPIFTNLTFLSITLGSHRDPVDLTSISEILRTATSLQDVLLENCRPSRTGSPISGPQIMLPHLKSFRISSQYTPALAALLHHITFPETASLDFSCTNLVDGLDALAESITAFFSAPPTIANSSKRIENLTFLPDHGSHLFITTKPDKPVSRESGPFFQCHVDPAHTGPSSSTLYAGMLYAISPALGDLESLTINLSDVSQESMVQHFGKLAYLHTIRIDRQCPPNVLQSLAYLSGTSSATPGKKESNKQMTSPPDITFPTLKTLAIDHVNFDEYRASEPPRNPTLLPTLTEVLQFRATHGAPIDDVVLEYCSGLGEEDILALDNAVPDTTFEWDEYEPSSSSEEEEEEEEEEGVYDLDYDPFDEPPEWDYPF